MIDEKKLIDDLQHGDWMNFNIQFDLTIEGVATAAQQIVDTMKESFLALVNAQEKTQNGWISTKETERLPAPFVSVLINVPCDSPLPTVHEGYLTPDEIWMSVYGHESYTFDEVPFWMPLPDPPEEEKPCIVFRKLVKPDEEM